MSVFFEAVIGIIIFLTLAMSMKLMWEIPRTASGDKKDAVRELSYVSSSCLTCSHKNKLAWNGRWNIFFSL